MSDRRRRLEHPENDLVSDADYSNLPRPEARDFDELADAPDPLEVAAANRRSTKQAIMWVVGTLILTVVVAAIFGIYFRTQGGPLCDVEDGAVWLCTTDAQMIWGIAVLPVPILSLLGACAMLMRKYRAYLRWSHWMGVVWFLVPHTLFWIFNGVQMIYASYLATH